MTNTLNMMAKTILYYAYFLILALTARRRLLQVFELK